MKNLLLTALLLPFLMSSCTEKKPDNTAIEQGIKAVTGYFGGNCDYVIGERKGSKEKYIEIRLSASEVLNKIPADLAMSNIAYIFYNNLGEEKAAFTYIKSIAILATDDEKERDFRTSQLEKVTQRMPLLISTLETIKAENFEKIKADLNTDQIELDKDQFIETMQIAEETLGEIKRVTPCGFRITRLENGFELLQLVAILTREYQNSKFSIEIDLNGNTDDIYSLNYEF